MNNGKYRNSGSSLLPKGRNQSGTTSWRVRSGRDRQAKEMVKAAFKNIILQLLGLWE